MESHPNVERAQGTWDAVAQGDFGAGLDDLSESIFVENGPGAGPWRQLRGRDAFVEFALEFVPLFGDTWHQDGKCVYADDRITISVVRETGTIESGDVFDNLAIWITRSGDDGRTERLWTVDIDQEACEQFWERNPIPRA